MSLCEFDEDDGRTTFRCAREVTQRIEVSTDLAGNPPYTLRYCELHAAYYLDGGSGAEEFTVVEMPRPVLVAGDLALPTEDDGEG